jgi:hypothetical protein
LFDVQNAQAVCVMGMSQQPAVSGVVVASVAHPEP